MRPQEAKRQVSLAIRKALRDDRVLHIKNVATAIERLLDICWTEEQCDNYELLHGVKPYKYGDNCADDFAPSKYELCYISDRFMCQRRMEWLRGLSNSEFELFELWED